MLAVLSLWVGAGCLSVDQRQEKRGCCASFRRKSLKLLCSGLHLEIQSMHYSVTKYNCDEGSVRHDH